MASDNIKSTIAKSDYCHLSSESDEKRLKCSQIASSCLMKKAELQRDAINQLREEYYLRLNIAEQALRKNTLRIFGLEEKPNEDTYLVVLELFKGIMKLPIRISDLESCYRLNLDKKTRPIIVRFSTAEVRDSVLHCKKCLKGTPIGISEDLSSDRAKLYKEALNYFGRGNVWTDRGIIKVQLPNKTQLRFQCLSELNDYLDDIQLKE